MMKRKKAFELIRQVLFREAKTISKNKGPLRRDDGLSKFVTDILKVQACFLNMAIGTI